MDILITVTESRPQLVLASASPRRRDILAGLGVTVRVQPADVDESRHEDEAPEAYVQRLALAKAQAVNGGGFPVLGSDTVVVVDHQVLGKPAGADEALGMLQTLSGRAHIVLSAVALVTETQQSVAMSSSRVWFRPTSAREREQYWATGEPGDKAGAYAIQGLGAIFVERLEGSFTGVMGLPVFETAALLEAAGIQLLVATDRPT